MEAGDTKISQGLDDASDEGVEVRRGWGAGCSGLRNELRSLRWRLLPFMTKCSLLS